jgi:hypothetical protein
MKVFSKILRRTSRGPALCSPFLSRLEKVFAAKGDFIC